MSNSSDKFTQADLETAVSDLAMMPFFPQDSRAAIMRQLSKMCPSRQALRWLIESAINIPGPWPGIGELRGILCSRYDAADGIDAYSTIAGYTAADGEQRSIEGHGQRKAELKMAPESAQIIRQIAARKVAK